MKDRTTPRNEADGSDLARLEAMAGEYGMELVASVSDGMLDPELVRDLPVEWVRANCLLPVRLRGEPCVLCADPDQVAQREALALMTGGELRPVLAPRGAILHGIEQCYYRKDDSPDTFLKDLDEAGKSSSAGAEPAARSDDLLRAVEKAPITQLVNLILLEAVKRTASDIHFEPFESRLRVRYRIDGVLYEQASPPKNMEDALVSRLKVMARLDIAEKRLPQDGMAKVRVGEREIDIRVSTVPVAEGERVVLRLLDRNSALLPLKTLGLSAGIGDCFSRLLAAPNGMIVVSGPTGSGKTTTLYAALGQIDASRKNIMTIEEPIEYQIPDIGQIQVKPKIGLTFAAGLRHILRQDPDVILVGETRDLETAEIAVRASLTGHLVFTTLHTNDAPSAVLRLADMGVEPYLLASCLRGVLAQRLVRKLCDHCKAPVEMTDPQARSLANVAGRLSGRTLYGPKGCDRCVEGYRGRTGIFELLVLDEAMQIQIRAGHFDAETLRAIARKQGMTCLIEDGIDKVLSGATSPAELASVAG